MFRTRIIFKLILTFLLFSLMIAVPLTLTIVQQVDKMIAGEEAMHPPETLQESSMHKEFSRKLIEQLVPYLFYILVLAIMTSIFFSRQMLISLKALQKGSKALKEGQLDIKLPVTSEDELGDATRAFNEMAASLREKTMELKQKDIYVNAMLDPLWVVDDQNLIVDINPAFTRLFGHKKEDIVGASVYDFFDEKNTAIMRERLDFKRSKGLSTMYEIEILAKDGAQIPVLISGSPIFFNDTIIGKIGILKDFREQVKLRNELQQSKEYAETVMDSIEDELLVIDRDYKIVKANKVAAELYGKDADGAFCYMISHHAETPCWTDGYECPARMVFMTGRNYRTTHQHLDRAGSKRYHEIVASPIKDASGNVLHVIELLRDVTERMKHEQEIFQKNRELVALNNISNLLNKSLRADEIFVMVLDKMIEMMNMDGGGIFFIDEVRKDMTCHYHRGISDEYVNMLGRIKLGEDIPGKVAVTGQVLTTTDISKDIRVERSMIKHSGIRGYCCIPIRGKERIIGVFCLFSFKAHLFTPEEENILSSIGEMTGIALENIKLYEKMRELYEYQRKRREDEHTQLLSLSAKLGSAVELKFIMVHVLELLRNYFSADFAWLLAYDNADNFILKSSSVGEARENEIIYQNGMSSLEAYSILKKRPMVLADIRAEEKFFVAPDIAGSGYRSAIAVPMFIGEKPVGVFTLYYILKKDFKEDELHFLEIISNMLAVSIERSDFYLKAIMEKGLSDTILQSVADGIITVDVDGKIISVNKAVEKITGATSSDAVGLPVCDVFRSPVDNVDFRWSLAECFESAVNGKSSSAEAMLTSAEGTRMSVLINSAPVIDSKGNVTGVVNLLRDITKEKEIDRVKTEIIRSVSHEFRTPLSAIVGMTEMIIDGDLEEDRVRKYLEIILSEGNRLSMMVSDLLSIARIESGKERLNLEPLDMESIIEDVRESFLPLIDKKHAIVRIEIDAIGSFMGDADKLKQILLNTIDNALTYSDEGCQVGIVVKRNDDLLEIRITDNGWGIPEEDKPHLAERFYRGRHGERVKGTGLGLAICKEILKMQGGMMIINSTLGQGTEVLMSIPSVWDNGEMYE